MPYFYTPKSQDQGYKSVEGCDSVPELFIEEKLHSTCSTSWVTVGVEISLFTIYKPFYNVNLIIWVNRPIDKIYVKDDKENCCTNRSGFCIPYIVVLLSWIIGYTDTFAVLCWIYRNWTSL